MDPWSGIVLGLFTQVVGELVGDLVDFVGRPRLDVGPVDRPIRRTPGLPGRRHRRLDEREAAWLVREVADRFVEVRRALERSGEVDLPDDEFAAALAAVRDTLTGAVPVDPELVVSEATLDPGRLRAILVTRAGDVLDRAALSEPGEAVYEQLLDAVSRHVVDHVMRRPEFTLWADRRLLELTTRIDDGLDTLPERVVRAGERHRRSQVDDEDAAFSRTYAAHLAEELGSLQILGGGVPESLGEYSFDAAYTGLSAAVATPDDDRDDGLTGSGVPVAAVLATSRRAVLRGSAGSGKSTTLQWLAVSACRRLLAGPPDGSPAADVPSPVPFVVPLRQFVARELPTPHRLLEARSPMLAETAPAGWVDRLLRTGRALVLVDGLDEVPTAVPDEVATRPATLRADVERWLVELVRVHPEVRVVVTTRTSALDDRWAARSGFDVVDLLPMGPQGIRDLVDRWHRAVAPHLPPAAAARFEEHRLELPLIIAGRRELHQLAATPLLCALICALSWDRRMELPTNRADLYKAAVEMLLGARDTARSVTAHEGVGLTADEARSLLQRLAYHLLKNEATELPADVVAGQLARALARIRPLDATVADVERHLVTRTGLIRRDPATRGLHFVHRTFADHLGAREAVDEGDLGLLVLRGHDDRWLDVIVMAAAEARPAERGALLAGLLDRGRREPELRERLHLVAAAAMATSAVVEPPEVRARVERATAELIPPRDAQHAAALARAGAFVVDLLPGPDGLDETTARYVVRTAALIGTEAARDLILRFVPGQPSPAIIDELLRAWRSSRQPDEYARTVLAPIPFGDATVVVHRHRVQYLPHLPRLRAVRFIGDLVDLDPFAGMPALETLELVENSVLRDRHLIPLAECGRLRTLRLQRCHAVSDLAVLAPVGLTRLEVTFCESLRPETVGALTTLASFSLRARGARPLSRLPALPALRELEVGNRLADDELAGVERQTTVEHVVVHGVPGPADTKRLGGLPGLTRLTVRRPGVPAGEVLAGLRPLVDRERGVEIVVTD